MTSNLGSDLIQNYSDDDDYDLMKKAVMEAVGTHFRPEVINRIDEVVVFHSLRKEQVSGIAEIQLDRLRKRLAERELSIKLTSTALDKLVEVGFEPIYGARPLKRAIQQWIENPLAQRLLAGEYEPGREIVVDVEAGEFVFK